MSKERSLEQVSVRLEPELKAAVERTARAQSRTVSQQIRHYVASAEAQQPSQSVAA
jgi:hypothetical protein